ncbi:CBO0543 family protein [Bacillus sp. FJAT-27251]|uniref:CBO0543 family protein n=1 Tax=Bacillus sp. FJAT-27251 TaxID=1684142 RepID=UPI0006A7AA4B|nr:CBO0543 family protein [Bacillus sp. FJAT-27251]
MKKKTEVSILKALFVIGIVSFINLMRKPPIKDWVIIFLLKSYIASIFDAIFVKKGYLKYPVNLFKIFDISVLFSYLIFPVTCIYFNQVTKNSSLGGILFKCLLFSLPSTIAEHFIERKTNLIKYKRSWNSFYSFSTIAATFLIVRFLMMVIRKESIRQHQG